MGRPELEELATLACEVGGRYRPGPYPHAETALARLGPAKAREVVLAAGRDRWYRERAADRLALEVIFGPGQLPILLGRMKAPIPPAPLQPTADRHCPTCGLLLRVRANPYLADDSLPTTTPVWIMPEHTCTPTPAWLAADGPTREAMGGGTMVTHDEAVAHEARRRAAAGEVSWRP